MEPPAGQTADPMPTIGQATPEDGDRLGAFFERNDTERTRRYFDPFPLSRGSAHELLGDETNRILIAGLEGRIRAFSMLRWFEDHDDPSFGILVDDDYRGEGYGAFLTRVTIAEARRLGCPSVYLTTHAANEAARRVYEQCGFEEVDRRTESDDSGSRVKIEMRHFL